MKKGRACALLFLNAPFANPFHLLGKARIYPGLLEVQSYQPSFPLILYPGDIHALSKEVVLGLFILGLGSAASHASSFRGVREKRRAHEPSSAHSPCLPWP